MEKFTIVYGLTDYDCKKVDVCCEEEELPIVCKALYNYGRNYIWHRPIACAAYREDNEASFSNEYDYMYADCM